MLPFAITAIEWRNNHLKKINKKENNWMEINLFWKKEKKYRILNVLKMTIEKESKKPKVSIS